MGNLMAGERFSLDDFLAQNDSVYDNLTSEEWKKFKDIEEQLQSSKRPRGEKENQLTAYARDSLNILKVKLAAVKVLEERKLLRRDIAENTPYYNALLEKLRASDIQPSEYLFLEEKMAYLNQGELNQKMRWSLGLNLGLAVLVLGLGWVFLRERKKQNRGVAPELSRQETMVRNLIVQGKTNKEIAKDLYISLSTVKSHITNIYGKLNVANREELLEISTGTST